MAASFVVSLVRGAAALAPRAASAAGRGAAAAANVTEAVEVAETVKDAIPGGNGSGNSRGNASPSSGPASSGGGIWSSFVALGSQILDSLARGISSAMDSIQNVGAQIGGLLLQSITSFLGQTGQGIQQILSGLYQGIAGVAKQAFGAVTDLVQGGLKVLTTVASFASFIGGLFAGVFDKVFAIVGTLAESIGQFVSRVSQVIGVLGNAVTQVLSGIFAIVQDCLNSARKMSQDVLSIRNNTGMSTGATSSLYNNMRVLGISGNTVTSMFSNPMQSPEFFGMRARGFGLDGDTSDPKWVERLASKFQAMASEGPLGLMRAIGMLENLGLNNAEMMRVVNMPIEQLQQQRQYRERVDSSFGIGPGAIERIGERLALLLQRFEYFADAAKAKLVEGLLPTLEAGLEAATNFMAANAGKIADAIRVAMEWTYAELPGLILQGAATGLRAIENLMRGIARMLEEFSQGNGFIYGIMRSMAQFWDSIVAGIRTVYSTSVMMWEGLKASLVNMLPTGVLRNYARNLIQPLTNQQILQAGANAANSIQGGHAVRDLDQFRQDPFFRNASRSLSDRADQLHVGVQWLDDQLARLGTPDQRRVDFNNAILSYAEDISRTNRGTLDILRDQNNTSGSASEFHARAYMEQLVVQGMHRARTR